ncbi:MAG: hypothetical protein V4722_09425 [Bacteroidota bacterium]
MTLQKAANIEMAAQTQFVYLVIKAEAGTYSYDIYAWWARNLYIAYFSNKTFIVKAASISPRLCLLWSIPKVEISTSIGRFRVRVFC